MHHEWKKEEAKEKLKRTVEAYRQFGQGQLPAGPGADALLAAFRAVENELADHEPGPAKVVTDRQIELLLKKKASGGDGEDVVEGFRGYARLGGVQRQPSVDGGDARVDVGQVRGALGAHRRADAVRADQQVSVCGEVDANRELIGLGAASLGAGLSSAMVGNGSLSKTAVN